MDDKVKSSVVEKTSEEDHSESDYTSDADPTDIASDESNFHPNRVLYIDTFHLISKHIAIYDVSSALNIQYTGGAIEDGLRDAAKDAAKAMDGKQAFTIEKSHRFFGRSFTMHAGKDGEELAFWKHPRFSVRNAEIDFPNNSKHGSHQLIMTAPRVTSRTNQWTQDGAEYEWAADSYFKERRQTLSKIVRGKRMAVAKYAQPWPKFGAGGTLLVDTREIDVVVASLTMCVMLRRMLQREAARRRSGGTAGWTG